MKTTIPLRNFAAYVKSRTQELLPADITRGNVPVVLVTYDALIRPNFIPWLVQAWMNCEQRSAKEICRKNLECEVQENHPAMLEAFVRPLSYKRLHWSAYRPEIVHNGEHTAESIWNGCQSDPVYSLAVLATLENASTVFIPWMEKVAKRIGLRNLTYTKKHGMVDLEHADELCTALRIESHQSWVDLGPVQESLKLLEIIFSAQLTRN